jgi:hypothetical protein
MLLQRTYLRFIEEEATAKRARAQIRPGDWSTVKRVGGVLWQQYGRAYCLKIARDFNATESRAERFQLKKRLNDAIKFWGPKIQRFEEMVSDVRATYMTA